jgi:hypothetical protein
VNALVSKSRISVESWTKTNQPIPDPNGIKVADSILQDYVGVYQVNPDFSFTVSIENSKLFLQAPGQEKLEMFADTPTTFFLKVNDAQIEFVKDESGKVVMARLKQGGRSTEALRK